MGNVKRLLLNSLAPLHLLLMPKHLHLESDQREQEMARIHSHYAGHWRTWLSRQTFCVATDEIPGLMLHYQMKIFRNKTLPRWIGISLKELVWATVFTIRLLAPKLTTLKCLLHQVDARNCRYSPGGPAHPQLPLLSLWYFYSWRTGSPHGDSYSPLSPTSSGEMVSAHSDRQLLDGCLASFSLYPCVWGSLRALHTHNWV